MHLVRLLHQCNNIINNIIATYIYYDKGDHKGDHYDKDLYDDLFNKKHYTDQFPATRLAPFFENSLLD